MGRWSIISLTVGARSMQSPSTFTAQVRLWIENTTVLGKSGSRTRMHNKLNARGYSAAPFKPGLRSEYSSDGLQEWSPGSSGPPELLPDFFGSTGHARSPGFPRGLLPGAQWH